MNVISSLACFVFSPTNPWHWVPGGLTYDAQIITCCHLQRPLPSVNLWRNCNKNILIKNSAKNQNTKVNVVNSLIEVLLLNNIFLFIIENEYKLVFLHSKWMQKGLFFMMFLMFFILFLIWGGCTLFNVLHY